MMMVKKRTHAEIMVEILDSCLYPQFRTIIVHRANLNWRMLQRYLPELLNQGLLELQENTTEYVTTEKGRKFVEKWKKVTSNTLRCHT